MAPGLIRPDRLQLGAAPPGRSPDGVNDDQVFRHIDLEIDVVLGPGHEHAPVRCAAPGRVGRAGGWIADDHRPSLGQLPGEEVPR